MFFATDLLERLYNGYYGKAMDMTDHEFKHIKGTVGMKKFVRNYNQCLGCAAVTTTKFDVTINDPVVALFMFLQYLVEDVSRQEDLASVIVDKLNSMESKYMPIALYAVCMNCMPVRLGPSEIGTKHH